MLHNAKVTTKGNMMTVVVDLSKELGPSSTGKTILIAKGKEEVRDGAFLSINVFKYPVKK